MFVDASAIVAVMLKEDGHQALLSTMEAAPALRTSAIALFEAMTAVSKRKGIAPNLALVEVKTFVTEAEMAIQPITGLTAELAAAVFQRYGKGRGHPAQLNMGDCFSYAGARELGVRLLYKGDDFARTDLA